jgi:hypothetical protein
MIKYMVSWDYRAEQDLAEVWVNATDRAAVSAASREIDKALAYDADRKGDPLSEGLRAINIGPLRAVFEVSEQDRKVVVVRVREA